MSLTYRFTKLFLRAASPKKFLRVKGREELLSLLQKMQKKEEKHDFSRILPKNWNVKIEHVKEDPLYRIKGGSGKKKCLVFYLFGGGFINHPTKIDAKMIDRIIQETDAEVALLDYRLAMTRPLSAMCQSVLEAYEKVLRDYDAKDIVFLGFSSGASMGLYLWHYAQQIDHPLPFPRRLLLSSPSAIVPPPEELLPSMRALDKKDRIVSLDFMIEIGKYLEEEAYPDLSSPIYQDMRNFPPITLFMGTDEIFYAYVPTFEAKAKKDGFPLEVVIGNNLPHCHVILSFLPEVQKDLNLLFRRIKR